MRGYVKKGLILLIMLSMAVAAHAGNIVFTISGTLSLDSGVDSSDLDGATFTYTATFQDTNSYTAWGGVPIPQYSITTATVGTSTVTISGTATNDGTYSLGTSIFAPRFDYSNPVYPSSSYVFLSSGGAPPTSLTFQLTDTANVSFQLQMTPSFEATQVAVGTSVDTTQFLGTSPVFYYDTSSTEPTNLIQVGSGYYSLTGGVATAVPEGKYVSLAFGLAGLGVVGYRRYNRRKAA